MNTLGIIAFALLSGIGPALVWLWFWLRQDRKEPEPTFRLLLTFIAGMVVVPLVFPFESALLEIYSGSLAALFTTWAAVEEVFKLAAAYVVGLTSRAMNEPIDALIYLITAALGFAALENALFLYEPLAQGDIGATLITGNMRFIGANVLHVAASAVIGGAIALSYYKNIWWRLSYTFIGIITAIALHTGFNFFIMNTGTEKLVAVFAVVWLGIIGLIFIFQRVKYIEYKHDHNLPS